MEDEFMAHAKAREFELRTKVGDEWATVPIAIRTEVVTNDQAIELVLRNAYRSLEGLIQSAAA